MSCTEEESNMDIKTKPNRKSVLPGLFLAALAVATLMPGPGIGQTITSSKNWKNTIAFEDDPFYSFDKVRWIKFMILLEPYDSTLVYYLHSKRYAYHYNGAASVIDPFLSMTPQQFNAVSLFKEGQQVILGTVIVPPKSAVTRKTQFPEFGVQFVRQDPFSREEIRDLFNQVCETVLSESGTQPFYFPTFEQRAAAERDSVWFAGEGIELSSTSRWARGNTSYAQGWAMGRVTFVPASEIENACRMNELGPSDILLTDGIPADVPFVAGILSLTPSTPNSHVALLAKTYNIPFVHLVRTEDRQQALALEGRRVLYSAYNDAYGCCDVRLIDAESTLDDDLVADILSQKNVPPLSIPPKTALGVYGLSTLGLNPADIPYVGGRAAHTGILREALPDHSPKSVALTFDLWDTFLKQIPTGSMGRTLGQEIAYRLAPYQTYPPADLQALSADLASIRRLFVDAQTTSFSDELQAALLMLLADPITGFGPQAMLNFRSSTNMEGSRDFIGAGLYDSYSGCLAGSLSSHDEGPSVCDLDRANPRSVFDAIRETFASFYNDNAFLERLRHQVPESEVGMALLVHHAFPDEFELANGVARLEQKADGSRSIRLVTQVGAFSASNPDNGSIPEEVNIDVSASGIGRPKFIRSSSLLPVGRQVMSFREDYEALRDLLLHASDAFSVVTGRKTYILDLEYKKVAPGGTTRPEGGLIVKQVRPVPRPDASDCQATFLVNKVTEYEVFTGEVELEEPVDVFAHHRLKSRWTLETNSRALDGVSSDSTLYGRVTIEYIDDDRIVTVSEPMAQLPSAAHTVSSNKTVDSWVLPGFDPARHYQLSTTEVPTSVAATENPILTLQDLGCRAFNCQLKCLSLDVRYDGDVTAMQPSFGSADRFGQTSRNRVYLWARDSAPKQDDIEQFRSTPPINGISIRTSFYYPAPPGGLGGWVGAVGATAPLKRWGETIIEGLTQAPIVLKGYYSQTMHPEHHNFAEHFLFEPRLEPDISPSTLTELETLGVRLIYLFIDHQDDWSDIVTFGFETR